MDGLGGVRVVELGGRRFRHRKRWDEEVAEGGPSAEGRPAPQLSGDAFQGVVNTAGEGSEQDWEATIARVRAETSAQIEQHNGGRFIIRGGSRDVVLEAQRSLDDEIKLKSKGGKSTVPYTHVVMIPLSFSWVQDKVSELQERILALGLDDVDETILQNPETLHCAICKLRLGSPWSQSAAAAALQDAAMDVDDILRQHPLILRASGLGSIPEGNQRKAHVLHVELQEVNKELRGALNSVCAAVSRSFQRAKLLTEEEMRQQKVLRQGEIRPLYATNTTPSYTTALRPSLRHSFVDPPAIFL